MLRIKRITIPRKNVKAPVYEQIVTEDGQSIMATFKFQQSSYNYKSDEYFDHYERAA